MRITGILLIIVGVIMLVWTGFSFTKKEKIVDAGADRNIRRPERDGQLASVSGRGYDRGRHFAACSAATAEINALSVQKSSP